MHMTITGRKGRAGVGRGRSRLVVKEVVASACELNPHFERHSQGKGEDANFEHFTNQCFFFGGVVTVIIFFHVNSHFGLKTLM